MRNHWLILAAGVVGTLATLPGQTNGVSPFIDFLIDALAVSRNNLSLAYLVGTVCSAAIMPFAGAMYDRTGSRSISAAAGAALGLSVLAISFADRLTGALLQLLPMLSRALVATAVMSVGFFLLRFFGQGVLNMTSRTMVMKWFDQRRGFANAIMAPTIALGFSYAPRVFDRMIATWGWRASWQLMGAFLLLCFAGFALLFFKDPTEAESRYRPTRRGRWLQLPPTLSRALRARAAIEPPRPEHDYTLKQARRTRAFWIFNLVTGFASLVGTGLTFHVVNIFSAGELSRSLALGVFFPSTVVAVTLQFGGSVISDYVRLRYFASLQALGSILVMIGILFIGPGLPYLAIVVGMGLNSGLFAINSVITWPRFFGLSHLGSISGANVVWVVAGSALGPYAFSLGQQLFGSYGPVALVLGLIAAGLFLTSFFAENPNRASVANRQAGC